MDKIIHALGDGYFARYLSTLSPRNMAANHSAAIFSIKLACFSPLLPGKLTEVEEKPTF